MARVRIAKGGGAWLLVAALATSGLVLAAVSMRTTGVALVAVASVLILGFLLNFFRDPDRAIADGLASPADGVVSFVEDARDGTTRVAIFMNPFDVHVNRAPADGRVVAVEHKSGGFVPAFKKESERNERVEWAFDTLHGRVVLHQIAGTVARRIVPYLSAGAAVKKGDRIGMIRLGSRVDLWLPADLQVQVKKGDRVWAASTTLATPRK